MKSKVIKWPRAKYDLIEHYSVIAADKIEPAERFLEVAEDAFERLAEMPGIGRKWDSPERRLARLRVYPIPGFRNYLIFYREIDGGIEVLTILHGARDLDAALDDLPT